MKLSYSSWLNKMCSSHSVSFVSARINKKSFKLYGYNKNCETIKSNKQIFGTSDLNCGYSASLRYCVRSGSENVCLPHPYPEIFPSIKCLVRDGEGGKNQDSTLLRLDVCQKEWLKSRQNVYIKLPLISFSKKETFKLYLMTREDKGDREAIPHTHPIP